MSRPPLSDRGLARLQEALDQPDLAATKYRMIRRLARGGMGTVYLVEDADLGREVALKVLSAPDPSGSLSRASERGAAHGAARANIGGPTMSAPGRSRLYVIVSAGGG
jgi:serine/threonine protein kinase